MTFSVDITAAPYNADKTGVVSCGPALALFNTNAVASGDDVELTFPNGFYNHASGENQYWAKDIRKLTVFGNGSILQGAVGFFLGGQGIYEDGNHSARTATVAAGSTTVTLSTPSQHSLFTVGQYAMMSGYDMMGVFNVPGGMPPNLHFFDYVKVTAKNTVSGLITFDRPLQNSYKSTWPNFNSGNGSNADAGGPATLYALDPSWDCEHEYSDLIIKQAAQTNGNGRDITYRRCTFPWHVGIPSQNLIWRAINCAMTNIVDETSTLEVDKLIDTMVVWGPSTAFDLIVQFQSSSVNNFIIGGNPPIDGIQGTAKRNIFADINQTVFYPGAMGYGRTDSVYAKGGNCMIFAEFAGVTEKGTGENGIETVASGWSITDGIIKIPKDRVTAGVNWPQRWCVPGTWCMWDTQGSGGNNTAWRVVDVTEDGTYFYVETTLTLDAFPALVPLWISVHQCPDFTFDSVGGVGGHTVPVSLSALSARQPLPIDVTVDPKTISIGTNNGVTIQTLPRSFLATL